jgi:hypothetical protein
MFCNHINHKSLPLNFIGEAVILARKKSMLERIREGGLCSYIFRHSSTLVSLFIRGQLVD